MDDKTIINNFKQVHKNFEMIANRIVWLELPFYKKVYYWIKSKVKR